MSTKGAVPAPVSSTTPSASGAAPARTAETVSVVEVLTDLDGSFASMAAGVASAEYVLWLGSGISRGRVDDLAGLIKRALEHVRARMSATAPEYAKALDEALDLADLSSAEKASIDTNQVSSTWPLIETIAKRLVVKYSHFLDIRVSGQLRDYLLWEAADAASVFGSLAVPDCEHICIAILMLEGVMRHVVSANWDGLIESAIRHLGASPGVLNVCVRNEDLRNSNGRSRLLKFHGCAVLAATDAATYRPLLVASQSQITEWPASQLHRAMRLELEGLATKMRTLMIGLSAQDSDIQAVFVNAKQTIEWVWPCSPPAHVFAANDLGVHQKNILRCVYGDGYDNDPVGAEAAALFVAYGKQLLLGLTLHVFSAKLQVYATLIAGKFSAMDRDELRQGLQVLRDAVASNANLTSTTFVDSVWQTIARGLCFLQEGKVEANLKYRPIGVSAVRDIPTEPGVSTSGVSEAALVLALLGDGHASGAWSTTVRTPPLATDGVLTVQSTGRTSRVFFAANGTAYVGLFQSGTIDARSSDAVVFHSDMHTTKRRSRSPRGAPGRTGTSGPREVIVPDVVGRSASLADLRTRFRQEAAL